MCYHSRRRAALAELEHQTEVTDDPEESIEPTEQSEAHSAAKLEMPDQRPEPVGHA